MPSLRNAALGWVVFSAVAAAATLGSVSCQRAPQGSVAFVLDHGGIVRADTSRPRLSLVFTGGDFGDGGAHIRQTLRDKSVKAGFFFTGDFYRTPAFAEIIRGLVADGHYLGPHSDKHLLYCPWDDREKTLVTREEFRADLERNFREMARFGIARRRPHLFIPPYEWFNGDISSWAREMGLVLFNFTPGTSSNADYTTPSMPEYLSSEAIYTRILDHGKKDPRGLNGFILLIHVGTDPARTDKFYLKLGGLVDELKRRGYELVRIDGLLGLD